MAPRQLAHASFLAGQKVSLPRLMCEVLRPPGRVEVSMLADMTS